MTQYSALGPLVRGLAIARLGAVTVLLGSGLLLNHWGLMTVHLTPLVGALSAAIAVSIHTLARSHRARRLEDHAWALLTLDVILVTIIVSSTGGGRSLFAFLYVLSIMAASILLPPTGSLWIAAFSSVLYAGVVLIPPLLLDEPLYESIDPEGVVVLGIVTNSAVFFLVALLGRYLAQRLLKAHQALSIQRENLDDLQAFNALLLQSMGAGLVAIDRNGKISAFNRAAEEITGFDASEVIGQPFEMIFPPEIHFADVWDEATRSSNRQARRYETKIRKKDGQETPLGISFSPLLSGKGHAVGLIGICRDLTEIKRVDRRVRLQDRLATVGRLAGNIAHEIRNPLASLSGAVELLSRERIDEETRARLMEIVLRESDRLNRTIMNFLEYARPDPLQPCPGNLAEILDEVLVLIERRPQLPPTLKVVREFPPDLPVLLDPQQVRQALWNLCLNAVEAMPDGGELRVGARETHRAGGTWVEVWVADTGHGVRSEDLPHIFEPFFTTKPQGSGLGLALAHRMAQDHGGEIEVKSEVGTGTAVLLLLPQESAVLTA